MSINMTSDLTSRNVEVSAFLWSKIVRVLEHFVRSNISAEGGSLMAGSSEARWILQIPFIAEPGFTLEEERTGTFADINASFRPASFGYTNVIIGGLESEQVARQLFEAVRRGLLAASLTIDWGLRVRDEVRAFSEIPSSLSGQVELPLVYQENQDLRRLLGQIGPIRKQVDKIWPTLVDTIDIGIRSEPAARAMTDGRVKLAFDLHADSYFERSEPARFLALIGVFEVLKDKQSVSGSAQQMIQGWQEEVSSLADAEADSLRGSLNYLMTISIARGIGSVVERHLGPAIAKEAKALYRMRSELVHDGKRPDELTDVVRRTKQIVKDLLAHVLMTGAV